MASTSDKKIGSEKKGTLKILFVFSLRDFFTLQVISYFKRMQIFVEVEICGTCRGHKVIVAPHMPISSTDKPSNDKKYGEAVVQRFPMPRFHNLQALLSNSL